MVAYLKNPDFKTISSRGLRALALVASSRATREDEKIRVRVPSRSSTSSIIEFRDSENKIKL